MTTNALDHPEIRRAQDLFAEAVAGIEADGGDVRTFASAALILASELYAETWGPEALARGVSRLAEHGHAGTGTTGRA